ncbi:metal-dependent hydrolase [Parasphingorhabdus sp.]|jgi:predicted metal-dependent hydrolase|uniref:metal-dependent hydrolase n=1 Tax=Parasphingorhabdus sp. TaxID=2709688 RepID=UPI0030B605AD|nr:metal-dependent hydrolase [Sphingomonadales bacterium]
MDIAPTIANAATGTNAQNKSATPADLHIRPRNRYFSNAVIDRRRWVGGDPFASAFFNALSVTFPKGETFFIESIKKFRSRVPPKLQQEILAFIQQEAIHSREHHCFNEHLKDCDFDITRLEQAISNVVNGIREMPETAHLVATMCIEHITAILAAEVIANPKHFEHADEQQRKLWLWHASEEIEHKGVAYDTWLHVTKDWNPLKRWFVRSSFMAKITLGFTKNRAKGVLDLLRQDGISGPRAWLGLAHYAFVGKAPFRRTLWPLLQFFKPGFHPWDIDDRPLIRLAESEYEAAIMVEVGAGSEAPTIIDQRETERLKKVA